VRAQVSSDAEGAPAAAPVRVVARGSGLHELTFHLDTVRFNAPSTSNFTVALLLSQHLPSLCVQILNCHGQWLATVLGSSRGLTSHCCV
jgi:hypothetical protein